MTPPLSLALDQADRRAIGGIRAHLARYNPGSVLGLYLYGSTVTGERGPDSDLDLLLLTRRSLDPDERNGITRLLLSISGWRGHADAFPDAADRRPIELTSSAIRDEHPAEPRARYDYQYGEWLRAALVGGSTPQPAEATDALVLLATAQHRHQRIDGEDLATLVDPVSASSLQRAAISQIPALLDELRGDERNVLLTLARIAITSETGRIVSKRRAAELVATRLRLADSALLRMALAEHLGHEDVDWAAYRVLARQCAQAISELTRRGNL